MPLSIKFFTQFTGKKIVKKYNSLLFWPMLYKHFWGGGFGPVMYGAVFFQKNIHKQCFTGP